MTRCQVINKILEARKILSEILEQTNEECPLPNSVSIALYQADVNLRDAHVKATLH